MSDDGEHTYGAKTVARALRDEGVEAMFGILGAPDLALEEGVKLGIKVYEVRHEQAGVFAADAYARCLRRPGVAFTSAAPGATNAATAMYHAKGAMSPVVLIAGTSLPGADGLPSSQHARIAELFRESSKWSTRVLDTRQLGFWIRKALRDAVNWPPGPITLEFPMNCFTAQATQDQFCYPPKEQVAKAPRTAGDPDYVKKAVEKLLQAQRPAIIAGDGVYWSEAEPELVELAELLKIPVCTIRTARGAMPESHHLAYRPNLRRGFLDRVDVFCLIGHEVNAMDSWFKPPVWSGAASWIQIQETADDLWYGLPTTAAVIGASKLVLRQMIECARDVQGSGADRTQWLATLQQAKAKQDARRKDLNERCTGRRPLHPQLVASAIADVLDVGSTFIYDSFSTSQFLTDTLEAKFAGQLLDAGRYQTLGHSVGMAIGAQVARSGRQVIGVIGDGGFGIGGMDMETMVRYKLPAVLVLWNNSAWGGRSWAHDLYYPGRGQGSGSLSRDLRYDQMFQAVGCHTELVTEPSEIRPALDRAFNSGKPALLNVIGDTTALHPVRMRMNLVDTWIRRNVADLREEARAELRTFPPTFIEQVREFALESYGLDIPLDELFAVAGVPFGEEAH